MSLPSYRLRVELPDVDPPVWRSVRVPGHLSFADLHLVLQAAMGWEERHLWRFEMGDTVFGQPEFLDVPSREVRDAELWGPADLDPRPGDTLRYVYDFGDRWSHAVRVEEVGPADRGDPGGPAEVLDGAGRCPPEDAGGPPGYAAALEALDDPSHPEHRTWRDRLGADFDPMAFSPDVANAALLALFEPGGRIGSEELPLGPEVTDALDEIVQLLDEGAREEARVTDTVRSVAEELLIIHAEADGDAYPRARKLATWAAGALHAAFRELDVPNPRRNRMTLEELGQLFGISPASVGRRSRELRESARSVTFLPFPPGGAAERVLREMLSELEGPGGPDSLEEALRRLAALTAPLPEFDPEEGAPTEERSGFELTFGDVEVVSADPPGSSAPAPGPADEPPEYRAEHHLLVGEETGAPSAYREAARILEEHEEEMERESLEYLLRRGLERAPARARVSLLALAVRHFGTDVATWHPEGAGPWLLDGS